MRDPVSRDTRTVEWWGVIEVRTGKGKFVDQRGIYKCKENKTAPKTLFGRGCDSGGSIFHHYFPLFPFFYPSLSTKNTLFYPHIREKLNHRRLKNHLWRGQAYIPKSGNYLNLYHTIQSYYHTFGICHFLLI